MFMVGKLFNTCNNKTNVHKKIHSYNINPLSAGCSSILDMKPPLSESETTSSSNLKVIRDGKAGKRFARLSVKAVFHLYGSDLLGCMRTFCQI